MRRYNVLTLNALVLCLSTGIASASTITIGTDDGTTWLVDNIARWNTTGNTMDGISITASVTSSTSGAFTQTVSWAGEVGVLGAGWSLEMNDYSANTWDDNALWSLTTETGYSITSLIIDGKPGNTVFDIIHLPVKTPGSESGQEIWQPASNRTDLTITATYKNLVSPVGVLVDNSPGPFGDLYQTLTLHFGTSGFSGSGTDDLTGALVFSLDTDNVNAVPEPTTMLLFGTGLAGLAGVRRLRKK